MAKAPDATRAPRGTRILAKAFFDAADEVPEPRRAEVIKAALAVIRDEIRTTRAQAALVKARGRSGKTAADTGRKATGSAKGLAKAAKTAGTVRSKPPAKRGRKTPRPAEPAMSVEADEPPEI
jgi:hypothetical protein